MGALRVYLRVYLNALGTNLDPPLIIPPNFLQVDTLAATEAVTEAAVLGEQYWL